MILLTRINPQHNERRFYSLHLAPGLFGGWSLVREWGRIGSGGTVRMDVFSTEAEAGQQLEIVKEQKLKRGYILAG